MDKQQRINDIISQWFSLQVIRNKDLQLRFEIHNTHLSYQCASIYNKYPKTDDYNSHTSNYIYHCYLALNKTEDLTDLEKLSKYVHGQVRHSFYLENNETNIRIKVDGDRRATLQFQTLSLDGFLHGEGETELSLTNILTQDSSLFHNLNNQIFFNSYFKSWFKNNKQRILTASQLEFLNTMESIPQNTPYKTIKEQTGIDPRNINDKYNRIADRIIKAYQIERPQPLTRYHKDIINLVQLLFKANNIANRDTELDTLNQDLFDYYTTHFDELQPHLNLTMEQHQQLNRKQYNVQTLYTIAIQIEDLLIRYNHKLDELTQQSTTITFNNKPSLRQPRHNLPKNTTTAIIINFDGTLASKDS